MRIDELIEKLSIKISSLRRSFEKLEDAKMYQSCANLQNSNRFNY
jgi:hypothetical protein